MELLPSIDLRSGQVVRLAQGDFDRQTNYPVDPVAVARSFADAGSQWVHIVDLDGAKAGRVMQEGLIATVVAGLKGRGLTVQVGGGVRSEEDIKRLLATGAARVVVGTAALENWAWFEGLAGNALYAGKLVLALDAKDGIVATRGWTASSGQRATEVAAKVKGWKLAGILYTDVAVDGMLTGPNIARTVELQAASDVPVIASGGVGSIEHIRSCKAANLWGVVVGRAIYEGKVDVAEAVRVARGG
jgi:phosphoribosylformimino-5-aminoimidazole carboxamide ribotide isomerase